MSAKRKKFNIKNYILVDSFQKQIVLLKKNRICFFISFQETMSLINPKNLKLYSKTVSEYLLYPHIHKKHRKLIPKITAILKKDR